ncbi:MAG: hypothetical protein COB15_11475 [Flavobacteriales bacterium]|nr:MAG: hypothetical protein COB15_11475 [Flavobacteriales bacterium]
MTDPAHTTTTPADVAFTTAYLDDLRRVIEGLDAHSIATAIEWMRQTRDADGTIFICGNGGSASIASQMVVDIVKGASFGRQARFRMIGLTDSISTEPSGWIITIRRGARDGELLYMKTIAPLTLLILLQH